MRATLVLPVVLLAACGSPVPVCTPGATAACACATGGAGAQRCAADGTFGACECDAPDAAVPVDAAPVDASSGDAGANCPSPFVTCGTDCIDPRTTPAFCGASGDCTGATAGVDCGGGWCSGGRCVWDDCTDALLAGQTTDGLYLVDVDDTGPLPPADALCDMTTALGGWTLLYKIRNDLPQDTDPWWPQVGFGAGHALPTTRDPLPVGVHFEGPDQATRARFFVDGIHRRTAIRTQVLSPAGDTLFDVATTPAGFSALTLVANGMDTQLPTSDSNVLGDAVVVATSGTLPAVHTSGRAAGHACSVAPCQDYVFFGSGGVQTPMFGDDSVATLAPSLAGSTTLIWTRVYTPP